MDWLFWLTLALVFVVLAVWLAARALLRRGYGWLVPYMLTRSRRRPPQPGQTVHLLLCVADHYEPKADRASPDQAAARVQRWVRDYPRQFGRFRDSDGRTPRHSFFYPVEEYEPEYLDALAELCRAGFGEVEIHLHHQNDTAANLRSSLIAFRDLLMERHGLLSRHKETGEVRYGFIHGNWALCNSRPDGSWCGVNEEIDVLLDTGCYADFTYPSSPDPTQPPRVNRLYYAATRPGQPRSHFHGWDIGVAAPSDRALLLIQGPLLLDWRRRKRGVLPRIENGCIQTTQPPTPERIEAWLRARIGVPSRPDWFFVKLHAHGAEEIDHDVLLGQPMVRLHEALARRAQEDPNFHFHYVTAREMYNLAKAAEAGFRGPVAAARDFLLASNLAGVGPAPQPGAITQGA
jgi:hypothetical protein